MPKGRPKKNAGKATAAPDLFKAPKSNGNGASLGFEAKMFLAADKLRKNLEPSDYKHVALGLIFLKHISNAFEAKRAALLQEDPTAAEDPDEYLAENVFWVPKEARWSHLQANARQPIASVLGAIDDEIDLNIRMNETLEAMARAVFKDWFVDFGPTRAKMEERAPYSSSSDRANSRHRHENRVLRLKRPRSCAPRVLPRE